MCAEKLGDSFGGDEAGSYGMGDSYECVCLEGFVSKANSDTSCEATTSPTAEPTLSPSDTPTDAPTDAPTSAPKCVSTSTPTRAPTFAPTHTPTSESSCVSTTLPTTAPPLAPTGDCRGPWRGGVRPDPCLADGPSGEASIAAYAGPHVLARVRALQERESDIFAQRRPGDCATVASEGSRAKSPRQGGRGGQP